MRIPACILFFVFGVLTPVSASIAEDVRSADAKRVLATIAGDANRLADLLSEQLRYGHADGRVQTKEDFLAAVRSNQMRYEAYDYEELQITPTDDNVAILSGRASLRVRMGEQQFAFRLRFLAVWRHEGTAWRLFVYQSAQLPATTTK
ncbi:MAG: nuclear transport factor 2 family protein [Cephaloticoccus sp.]|nr:nuclear transport factor 2 family protein [Cephaloticoccus sp.]MCF7759271.1 nuclear transport factor 2 family protein [Cephaloticoccus sp.]